MFKCCRKPKKAQTRGHGRKSEAEAEAAIFDAIAKSKDEDLQYGDRSRVGDMQHVFQSDFPGTASEVSSRTSSMYQGNPLSRESSFLPPEDDPEHPLRPYLVTDQDFDTIRDLEHQEMGVDWAPLSRGENYALHRRPVMGTTMFEYRASGTIPECDPTAVYLIQFDNEYRRTWDQYLLDLEEIETVGGTEIVYTAIKFPMGVSNRDYLWFRRGRKYPDGDYLVFARSGKHEKKPESSSYIRADVLFSGFLWRQSRTVPGGIDFFYTWQDDLKGSIPGFIVKWAATRALPDYMTLLQKTSKEFPGERRTPRDATDWQGDDRGRRGRDSPDDYRDDRSGSDDLSRDSRQRDDNRRSIKRISWRDELSDRSSLFSDLSGGAKDSDPLDSRDPRPARGRRYSSSDDDDRPAERLNSRQRQRQLMSSMFEDDDDDDDDDDDEHDEDILDRRDRGLGWSGARGRPRAGRGDGGGGARDRRSTSPVMVANPRHQGSRGGVDRARPPSKEIRDGPQRKPVSSAPNKSGFVPFSYTLSTPHASKVEPQSHKGSPSYRNGGNGQPGHRRYDSTGSDPPVEVPSVGDSISARQRQLMMEFGGDPDAQRQGTRRDPSPRARNGHGKGSRHGSGQISLRNPTSGQIMSTEELKPISSADHRRRDNDDMPRLTRDRGGRGRGRGGRGHGRDSGPSHDSSSERHTGHVFGKTGKTERKAKWKTEAINPFTYTPPGAGRGGTKDIMMNGGGGDRPSFKPLRHSKDPKGLFDDSTQDSQDSRNNDRYGSQANGYAKRRERQPQRKGRNNSHDSHDFSSDKASAKKSPGRGKGWLSWGKNKSRDRASSQSSGDDNLDNWAEGNPERGGRKKSGYDNDYDSRDSRGHRGQQQVYDSWNPLDSRHGHYHSESEEEDDKYRRGGRRGRHEYDNGDWNNDYGSDDLRTTTSGPRDLTKRIVTADPLNTSFSPSTATPVRRQGSGPILKESSPLNPHSSRVQNNRGPSPRGSARDHGRVRDRQPDRHHQRDSSRASPLSYGRDSDSEDSYTRRPRGQPALRRESPLAHSGTGKKKKAVFTVRGGTYDDDDNTGYSGGGGGGGGGHDDDASDVSSLSWQRGGRSRNPAAASAGHWRYGSSGFS